jgi:septal ring factor EnvC (AmiA/AmiB activator)
MFARFLALKIIIGLLLFTGCASTPRPAPHFIAPSTVPIAQAQQKIAVQQATTHQHIQKAEEIVKTLTLTLPADKLKVDALTRELSEAQTSNDQLKTDNDDLAKANTDLTKYVDDQAAACNTVADNYDKQVIKTQAVEVSRHAWVKRFWIATVAAAVSAAWIFRGPLMGLIKLIPLAGI